MKKPFLSAVTFFLTLGVLSIGYAAWNAANFNLNTGDPLSATVWNGVVDNVNDLNTRLNGVTSSQWMSSAENLYYSDGSVGIGVSSPTSRLVIKWTGSTSATSTLDVQNGNGISLLKVQDNGAIISAQNSILGYVWNTPAAPAFTFYGDGDTGMYRADTNTIAFSTQGTEKIRIDGSGKVGIGTTNPIGELHVRSDANGVTRSVVENSGTWTNSYSSLEAWGGSGYVRMWIIWSSATAWPGQYSANSAFVESSPWSTWLSVWARTGPLGFYTQWTPWNAERMRIDSSGNVGIGTPAPSSKLEILHSPISKSWTPSIDTKLGIEANGNNAIDVRTSTAGVGGILFSNPTGEWKWYIRYSPSVNTMLFWTNWDEAMRIDGSGNIWIDTTISAGKLHIQQTSAVNTAGATTWATGSTINISTNADHPDGTVYGAITWARDQSNGWTTTAAIAPIAKWLYADLGIFTASSWVPTERMRIDTAGNVGIGTNAPLAKLDINGEIRLSWNVWWSSTHYWIWNGGGWGVQTLAFYAPAGKWIEFGIANASKMFLNSSWNLWIWTESVSYKLQVNGSFSATTKNFDIEDPRYHDPDKRLVHSAIEWPEIAVYYRWESELKNWEATVKLPEYFESLTRKDERQVLLTSVDGFDRIAIKTQKWKQVVDGKFIVYSDNTSSSQKFNWEVKAVRADVAPLVVESERKNGKEYDTKGKKIDRSGKEMSNFTEYPKPKIADIPKGDRQEVISSSFSATTQDGLSWTIKQKTTEKRSTLEKGGVKTVQSLKMNDDTGFLWYIAIWILLIIVWGLTIRYYNWFDWKRLRIWRENSSSKHR